MPTRRDEVSITSADEAVSQVTPKALRLSLLAVQREGSRRLARTLRRLSLSPLQGEILLTLERSQPMTLRELGDQLICDVDSPSRAVDRLVKRGAIRRHHAAVDRRKLVLRLTTSGTSLAASASEAFGVLDDLIAEHLSSEEQAKVLTMLHKLPAAASLSGAELTMAVPSRI